MKTTLIQLIGGQIRPNIYPVLAFKPDTLVNVYSEETKKHEPSLQATAHEITPNLDIRSIYLTESPSTEETQDVLRAYIEKEANEQNLILINYTGGTKLMSIGAFLAAKESTTASVYLNTQMLKFCDGKTSNYSVIDHFLNGDESSKEISRAIPLRTILTAHHFSIKSSPKSADSENLLHLAHAIDELLQLNPEVRLKLYESSKEKDALRQVEELLRTPFDFGAKINQLCVKAKLMQWKDADQKKEVFIFVDPHLSNRKIKSRIQSIQTFLSGCWWELLLISELKKQIKFQKILWSVEVQQGKGTQYEEDILARIDTELFCISCKLSEVRGHIFAELHKLSSSTKSMGGSHSKPILAIYNFTNPVQEQELREIAEKLNITIITRDNLHHLAEIDIFKSHRKVII